MFLVTHSNETFEFVYNDCGKSDALNAVQRQFAPYLYPFVIEYCILVVGIWCEIYANIKNCPRNTGETNYGNAEQKPSQPDEMSESKRLYKNFFFLQNILSYRTVFRNLIDLRFIGSLTDSSVTYLSERHEKNSDHDREIETVSYVYADCQGSFHGVFSGLLLAILTIVFIILMFVGFQNR